MLNEQKYNYYKHNSSDIRFIILSFHNVKQSQRTKMNLITKGGTSKTDPPPFYACAYAYRYIFINIADIFLYETLLMSFE